MKKKEKLKTIFTGFMIGVLVTFVLFVTSGIISARKRGDVFFVFDRTIVYVVSGSMEPFLPTNSFILMERVDADEIEVGDVIMFVSDDPQIKGSFNTHQVIEIVGDHEEFVTKGTNNPTKDEYTAKAYNVVCRYVGTCLGLTAISNWFSTKFGLIIILLLVLVIGVEIYLPKVVKDNLKDKIFKAAKNKEAIMQELVNREVERLKQEAQEKKQQELEQKIAEEAVKEFKAKAQPEVIEAPQDEVSNETIIDEPKEEVVEPKEEVVKEKEEIKEVYEEKAESIPEETPVIVPVPTKKKEKTESNANRNQVLDTISPIRRSFLARICQASDDVKEYYNSVKNELLSYNGIKSRISWVCDSFTSGRTKYASIEVKGKTLVLYLALNPNDYSQDQYHHKDASLKGTRNDKTPFELRLTNQEMLDTSLFFIKEMLGKVGKNPNFIPSDYKMPYKSDEELLEEGLMKDLSIGKENAESNEPAEIEKNVKEPEIIEAPVCEPVVEAETIASQEITVSDMDDGEQNDEIIFTNVADALLENHPKRSFMSKLIQADKSIQEQYSTLKNAILSYGKMHARVCFANEIFTINKVRYAQIQFKGKKLSVSLAIEPEKYDVTKYHHIATPKDILHFCIPVSNPKVLPLVLDLIKETMAVNEISFEKAKNDIYSYPYESDDELIAKGLIKFGKQKEAVEKKTIFDVKEGVDVKYQDAMVLCAEEFLGYYNEVKNAFMSGESVTSKTGSYYETISCGNKVLGRFSVKQGVLCCFLGLNSDELSEFSCPYRQFEPVKYLEDTPLCVEITSPVVVKNLCKVVKTKIFIKHSVQENLDYKQIEYKFSKATTKTATAKKTSVKKNEATQIIDVKEEIKEEICEEILEELKEEQTEGPKVHVMNEEPLDTSVDFDEILNDSKNDNKIKEPKKIKTSYTAKENSRLVENLFEKSNDANEPLEVVVTKKNEEKDESNLKLIDPFADYESKLEEDKITKEQIFAEKTPKKKHKGNLYGNFPNGEGKK